MNNIRPDYYKGLEVIEDAPINYWNTINPNKFLHAITIRDVVLGIIILLVIMLTILFAIYDQSDNVITAAKIITIFIGLLSFTAILYGNST